MKKNLLIFSALLLGGILTANAQYPVFDDAIVDPGAVPSNANAGANNEIVTDEAYTGTSSIKITYEGFPPAAQNWGMYLITNAAGVDLTEFADGYLNFAMKTTSPNSFNVRITDGTNKPKINFVDGADPYDFVRDGEWHEVSVPIADMVALTPDLNMALIKDLFVWRSGASDNTGWDAVTPCEFFIDDITISTEPFVKVGVKNTFESRVSVYPNPANSIITVEGVANIDAKVLSVTGQVVKTINQSSKQVNVSDLAKGIYFLSGKSEGMPYVKKFVKN